MQFSQEPPPLPSMVLIAQEGGPHFAVQCKVAWSGRVHFGCQCVLLSLLRNVSENWDPGP